MMPVKVDVDYEMCLFDTSYDEMSARCLNLVSELEYVYFLCNRDKSSKLKTHKRYSSSYLAYLESLGFEIPELCPDVTSYDYWWGFHHNRDVERKLNSKLTSCIISNENCWGFKGTIVESLDKVIDYICRFPEIHKWIIKHPHSFSGHGQKQFFSNSIKPELLVKYIDGRVLLEPYYDRLFDIGTTYECVDGIITRHFMLENFISESGGFGGGIAAASNVDFKEYIYKKYNYSLDELEIITRQIAEHYITIGAKSNIQIDSFVFREAGELKLYALVEVNYRKTMGYVIQCLADKFSNSAAAVEFRFVSSKSKQGNVSLYDASLGWTKLSPEGSAQHSFMKIHQTIDSML